MALFILEIFYPMRNVFPKRPGEVTWAELATAAVGGLIWTNLVVLWRTMVGEHPSLEVIRVPADSIILFVLNLELVKKSPQCLEYVIVHETAHFQVKHHNERFVKLMDRHLPQWRMYRDELNAAPSRHEQW